MSVVVLRGAIGIRTDDVIHLELWGRISISIKFRELEYWGIGVMAEGLIPSISIRHHSITPKSRLSRFSAKLHLP